MLKYSQRGAALFVMMAAAGLIWCTWDSSRADDAQSSTVMHVKSIQIINRARVGREGPREWDAWVRVEDQANNPVSGAVVTGDFSGCFNLTDASPKTDSNGLAVVRGRQVNCKTTGACAVTFTVTNVSKSGASYEPQDNLQDSGSVTVCK